MCDLPDNNSGERADDESAMVEAVLQLFHLLADLVRVLGAALHATPQNRLSPVTNNCLDTEKASDRGGAQLHRRGSCTYVL